MFDLKCGDSMELMQYIPEKSIDLIVTDAPYGMNFQSHRRKDVYDKIKNDDNLDFIGKYFDECERIMKDNTAIYCFCSWHKIDVFKTEFEKRFKLKNILIWEKNNHGSGDLLAGYAPKYEMILYGNKGRRIFENGRKEDILKFSKTDNFFHPTQKPVDLLEFLITNSSKQNQVIFDGFMGSGSTGIACVNTGRHFVGIEIDDKYFEIAKNRIDEAHQKKSKSEQLGFNPYQE